MVDASQNLDVCRRTPEYAAAFEPMDLAEAWVLPEQPKPPGHRGPGAADTESDSDRGGKSGRSMPLSAASAWPLVYGCATHCVWCDGWTTDARADGTTCG